MKKDIELSTLMFWLAIIILIALLAWRILGSSPTIEQLGLGLAFFGVMLSWYGINRSDQKFDEQTQILKDIRDSLKVR